MNFQGGSGVLVGTPNFNIANLTNPQAARYPVLQEVSVEFKGDMKKLYGQDIFSLDILDGKVDVTGKGKMIVPPPDVLGGLFFGANASTGVNRPVQNESHAPAASVAPGQITAASNLFVVNGTTGNLMEQIASGSPEVGQYKFTAYDATGPVSAAYVFNASETAPTVVLNYIYPDAENGLTLELINQPVGSRPNQQMLLFNNYKGKLYSLTLNRVLLGEFSIPTKQEDHWLSDFSFAASTDYGGVLGYIEADI